MVQILFSSVSCSLTTFFRHWSRTLEVALSLSLPAWSSNGTSCNIWLLSTGLYTLPVCTGSISFLGTYADGMRISYVPYTSRGGLSPITRRRVLDPLRGFVSILPIYPRWCWPSLVHFWVS